jgi:hypothetical protein
MLRVILPPGFVDLATHKEFNAYDRGLDQPFATARIFRPEQIAALPRLKKHKLKSQIGVFRSQFSDLYVNQELFLTTRKLITDLTTDRVIHRPRQAILSSFDRLRRDEFAEEDNALTLDLTMLDWRLSRPERWQRLVNRLGIPEIPSGFRLYRGVHEKSYTHRFVGTVLEAWLSEAPSLSLPQSPLASWAFRAEPAEQFATDFGKAHAGVVLSADVPLDFIHANKLLDGGEYLSWWNQYEATVGEPMPTSPILTISEQARVYLDGKWFAKTDCRLLEAILKKM